MNRITLLLILLIATAGMTHAQLYSKDSSSWGRNWTIFTSPSYMLQATYTVQAEHRILGEYLGLYGGFGLTNGTSNAAANRNTSFSTKDLPDDDLGSDRLRGFLVNAGARFYVNKVADGQSISNGVFPYLGAELLMRRTSVFFTDYAWSAYTHHGLTYHHFALQPQKGEAVRNTFILSAGIQGRISNVLFIELGGGVSIGTGSTDPQLRAVRDYHSSLWDLGTDGTLPYLACRVGINFR